MRETHASIGGYTKTLSSDLLQEGPPTGMRLSRILFASPAGAGDVGSGVQVCGVPVLVKHAAYTIAVVNTIVFVILRVPTGRWCLSGRSEGALRGDPHSVMFDTRKGTSRKPL